MDVPDVEEHVQMFRRRAYALPAKHEVRIVPGAEWRLVRPPTPAWAILLLVLLFASGCVWAVTERHWTGLAGLVFGGLGVGLMRRKGVREHPDVEVIAKVSEDGQRLAFPLAGFERPFEAVSQMALRMVSLKNSSFSGFSWPLDTAVASGFDERIWRCVYVVGERGEELVFAQPWDLGNTGIEKALQSFCAVVGIPLLEPAQNGFGQKYIRIEPILESSGASYSTAKAGSRRLLLFMLCLVLFIGGFWGIRLYLDSSIRVGHTSFLLQQLEGNYLSSVASGQPRARSAQMFIDGIAHESMDWNSCRFHEGVLYDSWNVPLKVSVESVAIHLRSAGPDKKFGTADDIAVEMLNPLDQ